MNPRKLGIYLKSWTGRSEKQVCFCLRAIFFLHFFFLFFLLPVPLQLQQAQGWHRRSKTNNFLSSSPSPSPTPSQPNCPVVITILATYYTMLTYHLIFNNRARSCSRQLKRKHRAFLQGQLTRESDTSRILSTSAYRLLLSRLDFLPATVNQRVRSNKSRLAWGNIRYASRGLKS